jgi:hypothetical protein
VRLADGTYGTVPAESMSHALAGGAEVVSPDAASAAAFEGRYGGAAGAVGAGVSGFAGQATLGLSDQAIRLLSPETSDLEQRVQQAHPWATMAGQGLGAAALTAATGLGGALEGGGSIAARAGISALRGAVEGAQFGVAQSISDDAFSDHHLTAQQVLANIGSNALWGGGLGGAFGAAHGALGDLRSALATGAEDTAEAAEHEAPGAIDKVLERRAPGNDNAMAAVAGRTLDAAPADGLGAKLRDWYARIASAASGASRESLDAFVGENGAANRAALLEAGTARDSASRAIREHVDAILSASRDIQEEGQRGLKRGYIRAAIEGVDADAAAKSARDAVDYVRSSLDDMLSNPDDFGGTAPLARARKLAERASSALDAATERGDAAEMFGVVDDLKKAVGKYTKGASRLSPGAATDELIALQNKARAARLQEVYENVRRGLEDEDTWGKAATDQRAINAAWTTQIDASNRFHNALTTEVGRDPANPWNTVRGVDPAKADAYVRGLLDPSKDLTHKAVTDYVASTRQLADVMSEAYDLPAAKVAQVERLRAAADGFQKTLDDTSKSLALVNQFEEIRERTSGHGNGFGAIAGLMSHGIAGGLAGMALGNLKSIFTRPADAILQLAQVERMVRQSDSRIATAIRGFARGSARAASGSELEAYGRRAAQVRALVAEPNRLAERVGSNTGTLRARAPKLADAMMGSSLAGLALLRDKLPADPWVDPLDPKAPAPRPSATQRAKWLRYYDAVRDPIGVVEDLRGGRLSPEGVEVLKNVYPALYERTRTLAAQEMANGRMRDMTRQRRIGLGLMLDLPLPELSPAYIAARQAAYGPPPQPDAPPDAVGRRTAKIDLGAAAKPSLAADRVEHGIGDSN